MPVRLPPTGVPGPVRPDADRARATGRGAPPGEVAAAEAPAPPLPPLDPKLTSPASTIGDRLMGYRWRPEDLDAAMRAWAVGDPMAVVRTAIALDRGARRLSAADLEDAARRLAAGAHRGLRYSPSVLADIMRQHGLAEASALLRTAKRIDAEGNHDRYLNRAELSAAAEVLSGIVGANDLAAVEARLDRFEGLDGVRVETLGRIPLDDEGRTHHVRAFTFGPTASSDPGRPPPLQVIVTGGVHGNEPCGVGAALLLMEQLRARPELAEDLAITVVPVINPRSYAAGTRRTPEDTDLNRVMDAETDVLPEVAVVHRLFETAAPAEGVRLALDLHSGYAGRDGFWLYHRDGAELALPAMASFARELPALSAASAGKPMLAPGVVDSPAPGQEGASQGTLKDYAREQGCRWSFTVEAPGSVSYLDQVLGQVELVHGLVDQARLRLAREAVAEAEPRKAPRRLV
jgi:hypothetical protein